MSPEEFYSIFLQHPQVCTDSRKITPGCLFFALKGEHFDGNRFVTEALRQGCSYAVVDDPAAAPGDRCIRVPDVLSFLQELAAYHRRQMPVPVLALTGTNGKTTTKELIYSVLAQERRVTVTTGNLNNHIGVPLTLLSALPGTELVVVEMGANHPGEILFLAGITQPTHGLITNIGKAHLAGFGSLEGVIRAKQELFDFIRTDKGYWFMNSDDEILAGMAGDYPSITYGTAPDASVRAIDKRKGVFLYPDLILPDHSHFSVQTHLTGQYNLYNLLAAATVGFHFGLSPESIRKGIEKYKPQNWRSQWINTGRNHLFLDAYNANPSSMHQSILTFFELDVPKKVLILGDMFELGTESQAEHRLVLNLIKKLGFRNVLLVGNEFSRLASEYGFDGFREREDLIIHLSKVRLQDSTVLIKGSRGMQLEKTVDYL